MREASTNRFDPSVMGAQRAEKDQPTRRLLHNVEEERCMMQEFEMTLSKIEDLWIRERGYFLLSNLEELCLL